MQTAEGVKAHFRKVFDGRLENVGLMKKPYPFYGGIEPSGK